MRSMGLAGVLLLAGTACGHQSNGDTCWTIRVWTVENTPQALQSFQRAPGKPTLVFDCTGGGPMAASPPADSEALNDSIPAITKLAELRSPSIP
jgi:hypothetical protein